MCPSTDCNLHIVALAAVLCSGSYLCPPLASSPDDQTTKAGLEWRGQPPLHKVQLSDWELQRHIARTTISGRTFRAIEAAIPELERRKLRVEDYHIFVYRADTSLFVLFGSPADNSSGAALACPGPKACLRVELSADDLRVIGSTLR